MVNLRAIQFLLVLAAGGGFAGPCTAGVLFSFQYVIPAPDASFDAISAAGTLLAEPVSGGYEVLDISGFRYINGIPQAITGLVVPGGFAGNSNLLSYPNEPFLDGNGLSFTVAGPGSDGFGNINLYYDPSASYLGAAYTEAYSPSIWYGSMNVTTTPEPLPVALFPLGLAGLAVWKRNWRIKLRRLQR